MDFFDVGSAAVDWCEYNYQFSQHIAEYFNTISNIPFLIIPPIMMVLYRDYGKYVTKSIHIIWAFLIAIGCGSAYFHSTLSMAGQLMDEIFILWVLMVSYAILLPKKILPSYFQQNRWVLNVIIFILTIIITCLAAVEPTLNAYFLMILSIPVIIVLFYLVRSCYNEAIISLSKRTVFIWALAVAAWVADRAFCDFWISIDLPYFHSVFHILVLVSAYSSIVIFSYFLAVNEAAQFHPTLDYYPNSSKICDNYLQFLTIPFVKFHEDSGILEADELPRFKNQANKFS